MTTTKHYSIEMYTVHPDYIRFVSTYKEYKLQARIYREDDPRAIPSWYRSSFLIPLTDEDLLAMKLVYTNLHIKEVSGALREYLQSFIKPDPKGKEQ